MGSRKMGPGACQAGWIALAATGAIAALLAPQPSRADAASDAVARAAAFFANRINDWGAHDENGDAFNAGGGAVCADDRLTYRLDHDSGSIIVQGANGRDEQSGCGGKQQVVIKYNSAAARAKMASYFRIHVANLRKPNRDLWIVACVPYDRTRAFALIEAGRTRDVNLKADPSGGPRTAMYSDTGYLFSHPIDPEGGSATVAVSYLSSTVGAGGPDCEATALDLAGHAEHNLAPTDRTGRGPSLWFFPDRPDRRVRLAMTPSNDTWLCMLSYPGALAGCGSNGKENLVLHRVMVPEIGGAGADIVEIREEGRKNCLDVDRGNPSDHALLSFTKCNFTDAQRFRVIRLGAGEFGPVYLENVATHKALRAVTPPYGVMINGQSYAGQLMQGPLTRGRDQLFYISPR